MQNKDIKQILLVRNALVGGTTKAVHISSSKCHFINTVSIQNISSHPTDLRPKITGRA